MRNAFSLRVLWLPLAFAVLCLGLEPECANKDPTTLIQTKVARTVAVQNGLEASDSCSALKNQGSHFTVGITVGTPAQKFDVVADTGSNSVIVSSCICQKNGRCSTTDKCFTGTNKSSSFAIRRSEKTGPMHGLPPIVSMTFGSGQIEAAVASDVVTVAGKSARMDDGLLLMVSRALKLDGPFEGILGLGLPNSNLTAGASHDSALETGEEEEKSDTSWKDKDVLHRHGFLTQAKVPRFSVCFNDGSDGVLRLSQPPVKNMLGSIGRAHWAVEFAGISVGEASNPSTICTRASMKKGQKTACAAIPDSGTTLMMGPKEQIFVLFAELCDRWPRCKQQVKSAGNQSELALKFPEVLLGCGDWVNSTHGLDQELPDLHMNLAGTGGSKQVLKLPGAGYVVETMQEEMHYVTKHLWGIFPITVPVKSDKLKKVCTPAFGMHSYNTTVNGDVWIFGLPVFYEYQVGYELASKPPGISFSEEKCGSCSAAGKTQKADPVTMLAAKTATRQPRILRGPRRMSSIDLNGPL